MIANSEIRPGDICQIDNSLFEYVFLGREIIYDSNSTVLKFKKIDKNEDESEIYKRLKENEFVIYMKQLGKDHDSSVRYLVLYNGCFFVLDAWGFISLKKVCSTESNK